MKLCFATNNKHKLEEVTRAVNNTISIISLSELSVFDDLPETQNTFQGNALQKAQFVFDRHKIPCFADDSGLQIDALNGEPGVYSARYAGPRKNSEDNIDLVLTKLNGITNRKAKFITVIALVGLGPSVFFKGIIDGEITEKRMGTMGFGYDPIFRPVGSGKTFAEMTLVEKNNMSHRAQAVQQLAEYLNKLTFARS